MEYIDFAREDIIKTLKSSNFRAILYKDVVITNASGSDIFYLFAQAEPLNKFTILVTYSSEDGTREESVRVQTMQGTLGSETKDWWEE